MKRQCRPSAWWLLHALPAVRGRGSVQRPPGLGPACCRGPTWSWRGQGEETAAGERGDSAAERCDTATERCYSCSEPAAAGTGRTALHLPPPPASHSLPFTPACKAKPQAPLSCTHVLHVGIALLLSRGPRESEILYFLPVIRVNYTMHEYIRRCKIENIQCVSYRERADYNKVQIKFKVDWTIQNFVSSAGEVNSGDW